MSSYLPLLVVAAIAGAGLMAGLFFAFSNFVMRALLQVPHEHGMHAMQRINVVVINPLFLLVFLGTSALSLGIAVVSATGPAHPADPWWIAGSAAYLAGPLVVTLAFNVPLNNRLAAASTATAAAAWPSYAARWLFWNHVRTVLALVSVVLLAAGLTLADHSD